MNFTVQARDALLECLSLCGAEDPAAICQPEAVEYLAKVISDWYSEGYQDGEREAQPRRYG